MPPASPTGIQQLSTCHWLLCLFGLSLTGGVPCFKSAREVDAGEEADSLPNLSAREIPSHVPCRKKSRELTLNSNIITMAAPKVRQGPATSSHVSEEASGSSSESNNASDSESSHHASDSDSLDSSASRKRRKTSPSEEDAPPIHITATPSRLKSRIHKNKANEQTTSGAILAPVDPQATFASLNVKPWLVQSLSSMAIKRPTGIQKGCIPEILKGRDCIGGSRTGSGKTVAFAVPILQKWAEDPFGIFALVLTPTRYVCATL